MLKRTTKYTDARLKATKVKYSRSQKNWIFSCRKTLLIIFIAMAQPVDSRHPGAPHVMCHETIIHVTHCICTVYCDVHQQCKSYTVNRCEVENGPNRWNRLEYRSGLDGSDHRLTTHCSQPSMLHSVWHDLRCRDRQRSLKFFVHNYRNDNLTLWRVWLNTRTGEPR